jgi:hypothetical protein
MMPRMTRVILPIDDFIAGGKQTVIDKINYC